MRSHGQARTVLTRPFLPLYTAPVPVALKDNTVTSECQLQAASVSLCAPWARMSRGKSPQEGLLPWTELLSNVQHLLLRRDGDKEILFP